MAINKYKKVTTIKYKPPSENEQLLIIALP